MIKSFQNWLNELAGQVDSDPNNANMAFGIKGVNSKYHQREAPNGPSYFNPDKLFLGKKTKKGINNKNDFFS